MCTQSEASKFLSKRGLAEQFLRLNDHTSKIAVQPNTKYLGIKDNMVVFYDEEGNYFISEVTKDKLSVIVDMCKLAKNVLNMLYILNKGQADKLSLISDKEELILLSDISLLTEDSIKEFARMVLLAIEEINQ